LGGGKKRKNVTPLENTRKKKEPAGRYWAVAPKTRCAFSTVNWVGEKSPGKRCSRREQRLRSNWELKPNQKS